MKVIKRYSLFGLLGMQVACFTLSLLMSSVMFILIVGGFIRRAVEKYLKRLIEKQPNNGLLMLFPRDLSRILDSRYLFEYTSRFFIVLSIVCAISILIIIPVLLKLYHSSNSDKELWRNRVTKANIAAFSLTLASTIVLISVPLLIITFHVFSSNVATLLNSYLDSNIAHNCKNPFIEVFKGFISQTFSARLVDDPILQSRNKILIFFSLTIALSTVVILCSSVYLVRLNLNQDLNQGVKEEDDVVQDGVLIERLGKDVCPVLSDR